MLFHPGQIEFAEKLICTSYPDTFKRPLTKLDRDTLEYLCNNYNNEKFRKILKAVEMAWAEHMAPKSQHRHNFFQQVVLPSAQSGITNRNSIGRLMSSQQTMNRQTNSQKIQNNNNGQQAVIVQTSAPSEKIKQTPISAKPYSPSVQNLAQGATICLSTNSSSSPRAKRTAPPIGTNTCSILFKKRKEEVLKNRASGNIEDPQKDSRKETYQTPQKVSNNSLNLPIDLIKNLEKMRKKTVNKSSDQSQPSSSSGHSANIITGSKNKEFLEGNTLNNITMPSNSTNSPQLSGNTRKTISQASTSTDINMTSNQADTTFQQEIPTMKTATPQSSPLKEVRMLPKNVNEPDTKVIQKIIGKAPINPEIDTAKEINSELQDILNDVNGKIAAPETDSDNSTETLKSTEKHSKSNKQLDSIRKEVDSLEKGRNSSKKVDSFDIEQSIMVLDSDEETTKHTKNRKELKKNIRALLAESEEESITITDSEDESTPEKPQSTNRDEKRNEIISSNCDGLPKLEKIQQSARKGFKKKSRKDSESSHLDSLLEDSETDEPKNKSKMKPVNFIRSSYDVVKGRKRKTSHDINQTPPTPPAVDSGEFVIKKIVKARVIEGRKEYKCRYEGYDKEDDEWLTFDTMEGSEKYKQALLSDYNRKKMKKK